MPASERESSGRVALRAAPSSRKSSASTSPNQAAALHVLDAGLWENLALRYLRFVGFVAIAGGGSGGGGGCGGGGGRVGNR